MPDLVVPAQGTGGAIEQVRQFRSELRLGDPSFGITVPWAALFVNVFLSFINIDEAAEEKCERMRKQN